MMPDVRILVMREAGADASLPLPEYQTAGAAGADLRADLAGREITLAPGEVRLVPTGLRVEIPHGYEMQVRPRSGLALKHGVTVANAPGTVDSDYRGPLGVILVNLGGEAFTIAHGDRIAQAVIAPVVRASYVMAEALSDSDRAAGGFGSTGRA
ncbi:dUTP diphosphatase [Paracoccus sp. (in: a-proteobacteria)]|uniref:dUTP diphosphatase n=1 Tax=Paracoccus sp. TaxID=267 RepID=UPI00289D97E7|nr:dUTP diphosphatase [Paracoccus sp. (in: a-proteobacteria)]